MARHPSGIFVLVDGEHVDLDDAAWFLRAPCGCYAGVHVAWYPPRGTSAGEALATPEVAFKAFHESAAERKREADNGFAVEIGLRSQVKDRVGTAESCPHSPRWGVEPPPKPEGMMWAAAPYGRGGKVLHLVDEDTVETEDHERGDGPWGRETSLCKRRTASTWSTRWHHTAGLVECKGCVKAATHDRIPTL